MMVKVGPSFPSHLLPSFELHLPDGASPPPLLAFPGTWEVKVQRWLLAGWRGPQATASTGLGQGFVGLSKASLASGA